MIVQFLILFGIFINAVGTMSYVIGTVKGEIKPNKITFFIWSIAPLIAFFAQITQKVGIQSLMTLSVGIFPLSIFIASFVNKKSYWRLNLRDVSCGILSLLGLFLWYLTKVGNIAIFFSILSEGLATLPTIIKSYYHPETERGWPWFASVLSGTLTAITIPRWNFAYYAFPLFYTFEMFLVFFFVQFKIGKKRWFR